MIDWISIALLIGLGIILIIIELIFIPGTTFVGIIGFICTVAGIYLSFKNYGTTVGWVVLSGTTIANGVALYYSFKSGVWENFALKQTIDSKVNPDVGDEVHVGEKGKAISDLKPVGKGEFAAGIFEIRSNGPFIESGSEIEILRIQGNKIFVKKVNN